jgi:hypothetical protein
LEPIPYKTKESTGWGRRMTSSPIGVIFAYQSGWKKLNTIKRNLEKCLEKVDKKLHPNLICCLMDGYLSYYQKYPIEPKKRPQNIRHLIYPVYPPETKIDSSYIKIDSAKTFLNFLLLLNQFMNLKTLISDLDIRATYLPDPYKLSVQL